MTARCEDDLEALPEDVAEDILDKLVSARATAPEAGERVLALRERPCYSLHSGRYRAVTWFDRQHDVEPSALDTR